MKTIILLTLLILTPLHAQNNWRLPIWTYHDSSVNIAGLSLGFGSMKRDSPKLVNTYGTRIELIGTGFLYVLPFANIQDLSHFDSIDSVKMEESIYGVGVSLTGANCDCQITGINIGGIGNFYRKSSGLSISGAFSIAERHKGVQIALVGNVAYEIIGLQISLGGSDAYTLEGIQIGAFNTTQNGSGLQIGLLNTFLHGRCFQIGFWNKNKKRSLPIINW